MTDHEGEQAMELEALEAIFPDQLEEWEGNTPDGWPAHGKTWAVTIRPAAEVEDAGGEDSEDEAECEMQLVWAHTPTYPDEAPCIRLRSLRGLSDAELAEATAELQRHIEENLGMPMIFTLVTAAQEWLAARLAAGPAAAGSGADPEAEEKRRREEEEAARAAARAHGTPVTIEAFNAWRARYDAERKAAAAAAAAAAGSSKGGGQASAAERLTGKAWFLQQLAAGKGESSGSEAGEEELAQYEDMDEVEEGDGGAAAGEDDEEEEEEDEDFDDDDDDDDEEGVLEAYLAKKA